MRKLTVAVYADERPVLADCVGVTKLCGFFRREDPGAADDIREAGRVFGLGVCCACKDLTNYCYFVVHACAVLGHGYTRIQYMDDFDMQPFLQKMRTDQDLIPEILEVFVTDGMQRLEDFHAALSAWDMKRLYQATHSLVNQVGVLEAEETVSLGRELESAAREGDGDSVRRLAPEFVTRIEEIQHVVQQMREESGIDKR